MLKGIKDGANYILKGIKVGVHKVWARTSLNIFLFLYTRPSTGIGWVVSQEANRIGRAMTVQWLRDHGVMHCARCLSNQQLRKAKVQLNETVIYLCAKCFDEGRAAGKVTQPLNLVKP